MEGISCNLVSFYQSIKQRGKRHCRLVSRIDRDLRGEGGSLWDTFWSRDSTIRCIQGKGNLLGYWLWEKSRGVWAMKKSPARCWREAIQGFYVQDTFSLVVTCCPAKQGRASVYEMRTFSPWPSHPSLVEYRTQIKRQGQREFSGVKMLKSLQKTRDYLSIAFTHQVQRGKCLFKATEY